MAKNDGGPAFPEAVAVSPAGDVYPGMGGMSLRDWFAGQADVSGFQFNDLSLAASILGIDPPFDGSLGELFRFSCRVQAAIRFAVADAMIAERDRDQ